MTNEEKLQVEQDYLRKRIISGYQRWGRWRWSEEFEPEYDDAFHYISNSAAEIKIKLKWFCDEISIAEWVFTLLDRTAQPGANITTEDICYLMLATVDLEFVGFMTVKRYGGQPFGL